MQIPSENDLSKAIEDAVRLAVSDLYRNHPGKYYYLTLVTTGDACSPGFSAWSEEALEEAVAAAGSGDSARETLKWSYADSPFCNYGRAYFRTVDELFLQRPFIPDLEQEAYIFEYDLRLRAMEKALANLDKEGLFGPPEERNGIVLCVEVMPPDSTNIERACRLNPPEALSTWLAEAGDFENHPH